MKYPVFLASQSPRRKQILEWAGIPFSAIATHVEESYDKEMPKKNVPEFLARQKAVAAQAMIKNDNSIIIAADTLVLLHQTLLEKPKNREEAVEILRRLSGKVHQVISGVYVIAPNHSFSFSSETKVYFYELSTSDIDYYIDNFHPYDKAGSYAIQEWIGLRAIQKIEGCYFNVMGLPISLLTKKLKENFLL